VFFLLYLILLDVGVRMYVAAVLVVLTMNAVTANVTIMDKQSIVAV
jgi:hypothetical protein